MKFKGEKQNEKVSDIDYALVKQITKENSSDVYKFENIVELNDAEILLEKLNNKFIHKNS